MDTKQVQVALSLFGAGAIDGQPGSKTRLAVKRFCKHIMRTGSMTADGAFYQALGQVRKLMPTQDELACPCGKCSGFGKGRHEGIYRSGKPRIEAYYEYEYEGVSEIVLWAAAMIRARYPEVSWEVSSGYRCRDNNAQHHRRSSNHHGKAIDLRPAGAADRQLCNRTRGELAESGAQTGWRRANVISLEPSAIAPTWIHLDCRQYSRSAILASIKKPT